MRESRPSEFEYLFDSFTSGVDGEFSTSRSDVRILFRVKKSLVQFSTENGAFIPNDLAVGAGQRDPYDFGPEVGFGWIVGDECEDPIFCW